MNLTKEDKKNILKRCRELKIKTKSSQGVQLPWKTLIQKCLVYDLPDPNKLPPSTLLEEYTVHIDNKNGNHYWSNKKPNKENLKNIKKYPNLLVEHELLDEYQPISPDTMIPLDVAVEVFQDYFAIETSPEFLTDDKIKKLIIKDKIPFGVLMGEDYNRRL